MSVEHSSRRRGEAMEELQDALDSMLREVFNVAYADQVKQDDDGLVITLPEGCWHVVADQDNSGCWQASFEVRLEGNGCSWEPVANSATVRGLAELLARDIFRRKLVVWELQS